MPKIKTQDINGNWIYVDLDTRKVESAAPQQGTILRNANREVKKARSALRYKAQLKNKKLAEFAKLYNSHLETSSMVRTKQASPEEVDYGRTDKYEIIPDHKVIGMSGADPVGLFAVEMAALNMPFRLAGKAAMYGLGRYGENLGVENLSRWAKNRLVANEFRNSALGNVERGLILPKLYDVRDNITLYRANPTNPNPKYFGGKSYGDNSNLYVGQWFTDEASKPLWYASNYAKQGESPLYYQVTVPKYWAEKLKASIKISNPNIEFEPAEDYILYDGIKGLVGQELKGRPGTLQYLQLVINSSQLKREPTTSLKFFERKPIKINWGTKESISGKEYIKSPRNITSDVGDLIAEGSERSTYTSKSNPNIVYKIEDAPLNNIKNIKIRKEVADDIIAPETTVGYYNRNGKYYRVTLLDKYKSWNPDNFDINYSPELDLEIIDALQKANWNVELGTYKGAPYARTASKNGIKIGNLEYFNWGRDSHGNLKLIDYYVYPLK